MKRFEAPKKSIGPLDADDAATLIAAAADLSLVVDAQGVIQDVAIGPGQSSLEQCREWIGRSWADVVTDESRTKVTALLRDAAAKATSRWRHVNHPVTNGADLPLLYSAVRVGRGGKVVAFGRDLRAVSSVQQRLVEAQQAMERDYWRLRHMETRYRLLFQSSTEAVLVVDGVSLKVTEANPAAAELLGEEPRRLIGRPFPRGFDVEGTQAITSLLASARSSGHAQGVHARIAKTGREFIVNASMFRQETASLYMVRLTPLQGVDVGDSIPRAMLEVVERVPDGFVVTSPEGQVVTVNAAFIDMAELGSAEQARGESIDRWLGRPGVDFGLLAANLRQHGTVRSFPTIVRGELGSTSEVEVSAVSVPHGESTCLGFSIRNVGRRIAAESTAGRELPRSVEQLTKLVGRVSLKELVRESTDLIERLCIEAALELTGDNRASAAEMLGLSRQSLYVRLRRYGLGDLDGEDEP